MGEFKKIPGIVAELSSADQKDNLALVDSEHPERMYNISGATKDYQAIVQLEKGENCLHLHGALVLKLEKVEERGKIQGEATLILLHAVKIALEAAQRNNVAFRWIFSPLDPEGKMIEWKKRHLDNGNIKKEVSVSDVPEELKRVIDKITDLAARTGIEIKISNVDNPEKFSQQMSERFHQVREKIHKNSAE